MIWALAFWVSSTLSDWAGKPSLTCRSPPAVGFVGTIVSWFLMLRYGRRSIYLYGLSVLVVLQLLIGILDCIPGRPAGVAWAESSLMLVWNFFYDISVGPICFTLIGECSATRVRSKTIAVATAAQGVIGVAMTVAIPYMINPDEVRWSGPLASSPFPGARLTSLLRSLGQHARQTRVFLRRPRGPLLYLGLLPRSRGMSPTPEKSIRPAVHVLSC